MAKSSIPVADAAYLQLREHEVQRLLRVQRLQRLCQQALKLHARADARRDYVASGRAWSRFCQLFQSYRSAWAKHSQGGAHAAKK